MKTIYLIMKLCAVDAPDECIAFRGDVAVPYNINACLVAAANVVPKMNAAETFGRWRVKQFGCFNGSGYLS